MSRFSELQKKRDAQRTAWGIPPAKWGGDVSDELSYIPDEALILAYKNQRNPFNVEEQMSGGAPVLAAMRAELVRRHGETAAARLASHDSGGVSGVTRNLGKTTIGPALTKLAPLAAFIPGIGPLAAGAIALGAGGLGRGLSGNKVLDPRAMARDALLAGGGKYLMEGASLAGEGALKGSTLPPSPLSHAVSSVGHFVSPIVGAIKKDPLKAAQIGLAGYSAYQGQRTADRAQDLTSQAIGRGMGQPNVAREDVSGLFLDPSNPFSGGTPQTQALTSARRALAGAY